MIALLPGLPSDHSVREYQHIRMCACTIIVHISTVTFTVISDIIVISIKGNSRSNIHNSSRSSNCSSSSDNSGNDVNSTYAVGILLVILSSSIHFAESVILMKL